MTPKEKATQVADQCKVVAALGKAIAEVYGDYDRMIRNDDDELLSTDRIGARSAELMETLGDILNGMDAATDDDAWMKPIMERAHAMWLVEFKKVGPLL